MATQKGGIMKEDLTLEKEELERLENKLHIFFDWIQNPMKDEELTEEDKSIIKFGQLYIDLLITDDDIYSLLKRINCFGIDDLLNDKKKLEIAAILIGKDKKIIKAKLVCLKRRINKIKYKNKTLIKTNY